jgi:hypothetical protein
VCSDLKSVSEASKIKVNESSVSRSQPLIIRPVRRFAQLYGEPLRFSGGAQSHPLQAVVS